MSQLFNFLSIALTVYSYAILVFILMSWFPGARESSFGQLLARICEPFLEQFRRIIPPIAMIDFSPIIAIIVLNLANRGLRELYYMIAGM